MDKLKALIEQHGRWKGLEVYIERIEAHIEADFSASLENSKALLETISKEVCDQKGLPLDNDISINAVLKKAFSVLGYKSTEVVAQISGALSTIGQQMGNLRNEIGTTAHGKTLEEIRERNNKVDDLTKELLIDTTEIIACFFIRNIETVSPTKTKGSNIEYVNCQEFNEFWDETFGEFNMGDYSYLASEILFNVDNQAYVSEQKEFKTDEA